MCGTDAVSKLCQIKVFAGDAVEADCVAPMVFATVLQPSFPTTYSSLRSKWEINVVFMENSRILAVVRILKEHQEISFTGKILFLLNVGKRMVLGSKLGLNSRCQKFRLGYRAILEILAEISRSVPDVAVAIQDGGMHEMTLHLVDKVYIHPGLL
jgi:hypothetical protein